MDSAAENMVSVQRLGNKTIPFIPFPVIETQTFLICWHQSLKSSSVLQKKPWKKQKKDLYIVDGAL